MKSPHAWDHLKSHHKELEKTHLRDLLKDEKRNSELLLKHSDIVLDLTHEKINSHSLDLLAQLSEEVHLRSQLEALFNGVL